MDLLQILPQDSATVIVAVAAVAALIVSIATLWLSYFRGPSIEVVNSPSLEIAKRELAFFQSAYALLDQFSFVFVNNGGRTGVITEVTLDFSPNAAFKSFPVRIEPSSPPSIVGGPGITPPYTQEALPVNIPAGDSKVVRLDARIVFPEWKDLRGLGRLRHETVGNAIKKLFSEAHANLAGFSRALENHSVLGTVSVVVSLTRRKWLKTAQVSSRIWGPKDLLITDDLRRAFASFDKEFNSLKPRTSDLVGELSNVAKPILEELARNMETLKYEVGKGELRSTTANSLRSWSWTQPFGASLIKYHTNFESKLQDLATRLDDYNAGIQGLSVTDYDLFAPGLDKQNKLREGLKGDTEELYDDFRQWVEESIKGIQGLLA